MTIEENAIRKTKNRGASYPWIDLGEAIDKAVAFYRHERRNAAPVTVATSHWGYRPKASSGHLCVSALKKFGLMVDEGSNENRQVRLTDLAFRILLDSRDDSTERREALREAALLPKIHKQLWDRYGPALPSMGNLKTYLLLQLKCTEEGANDLIKEYKKTLAYAGLDKSDAISDNQGDEENDTLSTRTAVMPLHTVAAPPPISRPVAASVFNNLDGPKTSPHQLGSTLEIPVPLKGGVFFILKVPSDQELKKSHFDQFRLYLDFLETSLASDSG